MGRRIISALECPGKEGVESEVRLGFRVRSYFSKQKPKGSRKGERVINSRLRKLLF